MLSSDRVFTVITVAQAAIATVRAGSRALYMFKQSSASSNSNYSSSPTMIGVMDGPLILPEIDEKTKEMSPMWELATCFEHAVLLASQPELYKNAKYVETASIQQAESDETSSTKTPYSMSSFAVPSKEKENRILDEEIERILNESDEQQSNNKLNKLVVPRIQQSLGSATSSSFWRHVWPFSKSSEEDDYRNLERFPDIDDADFSLSLTAKIVLDRGGITMPEKKNRKLPKTATITAYAPESFEKLRSYFGVSEASYLKSLLHSGPFVSFQSNSKGAARVGGVFFFTRDGAYMIKTIKRDEVPTFLNMLPKYHRYMKTNGRRSLLTRFCGMYDVQIHTGGSETTGKRQTIVVMNSVFPAEGSKFIAERFDLKGSTMGRECSHAERQSKGAFAVLKDLDLSREVELVRSLKQKVQLDMKEGLHVGATVKSAMFRQLQKDVVFLVDCQVIDYSLLVGVAPTRPFLATLGDRFLLAKSEGELLRTKLALSGRTADAVVASLIAPVRMLLAPPVYFANGVITKLSNAVSWSLPYYGAERCGVDAGHLSQTYGARHGHPAIYYFGLIDFLQPWNSKKMAEYKWKSLRYGDGFSCVPPQEYADRFLKFVEQHIT